MAKNGKAANIILKEGVFKMVSSSSILLCLSIALLVGLLLSRLAKYVQLPAVTAYLIAGVLIGPFCLGAIGVDGIGITENVVDRLGIISDVALGFIAFAMGNEFRLAQLKKIGKQATVVGVFQAVFTTAVVDAFLIGLHFLMPDKFSLSAAIVLGAIATATAPAATLMVVRQYKAKGKLTDILLPVVALDDAVGLMVFAVSFGIARALSVDGANASIVSIILEPIIEIVLSLALGFVMGLLFTLCERFFHSRSKRMAVSVTFVMMTVAISTMEYPKIFGIHIAFSSLLSCMMLGTVFCNICDFSEELMERADRWTAPILILFFVISGAELKLNILGEFAVVIIGIVYIISRSLGKYFGARISCKMTKCDINIVKYLGITLLPQAGVALGMANNALVLGAEGVMIKSITLFAILIYEIVGPSLTKMSLTKAGDIKPHEKVSAREEARIALAENSAIKH